MKLGVVLDVSEVTTASPASPAAGRRLIYMKSDGILYTKDSSGNEKRLADPTVAGGHQYTRDFLGMGA